jgi:hypothetical protein
MARSASLGLITAGAVSTCLYFVVSLGFAACTPGAESARAVTVRDSAGIRIIENWTPAWSENSRWTVAAKPTFVTPAHTSDPDHYLFDAGYLETLDNGRIVVANTGTYQLFLYDSTGGFVRAIGRFGEGPGEFSGMFGMFRCAGDTIIVDEASRHSVFDGAGHFVRTDIYHDRGYLEVEGISGDCSRLLILARQVQTASMTSYRNRHTLYWISHGNPANVDTVVGFGGVERYGWNLSGDLVGVPIPFGLEPVWMAHGTDVYLGLSDRFEIRVYDRRGNLHTLIRWAAERSPVTSVDRRLFADRREDAISRDPEQALVLPPLRHFPVPDYKPTYSRLLVDDEGNLWVREYRSSAAGWPRLFDPHIGDERDRWWVFDGSGRLLGSVRIPAGFEIRISGHSVVGIFTDADDVQHLQRFELHKPVSAEEGSAFF